MPQDAAILRRGSVLGTDPLWCWSPNLRQSAEAGIRIKCHSRAVAQGKVREVESGTPDYRGEPPP